MDYFIKSKKTLQSLKDRGYKIKAYLPEALKVKIEDLPNGSTLALQAPNSEEWTLHVLEY